MGSFDKVLCYTAQKKVKRSVKVVVNIKQKVVAQGATVAVALNRMVSTGVGK